MKIEVLKENLKGSLSVVERIVSKNLSLPILNNVLITTEDNFLSLTSTDLEIAIRVWILVKILKKGSVVVPAKFLSQFISSLPNEKITLDHTIQDVLEAREVGNVLTLRVLREGKEFDARATLAERK